MEYYQTILVIEDDPNDQILVCEGFNSIGVQNRIQIVSSGNEAIAYLMGEGKFADRNEYAYPTFIMTDLKMVNGDGFSVLQHLKANPEWAVIPVVVLTASDDPDDVVKAYLLGASCYHQKPATQRELRDLLRILHDYWMTCKIPRVDATGRWVQTDSEGKLGERFQQPSGGTQKRTQH